MPENQAWRLVLEMEQVECASKTTVIPLFRFAQHMQISVLIFFFRPRRSINTLKHFVFGITPPVGPGDSHELEHFQLAVRRHMRSTTQVGKVTARIKRNVFTGRNGFNDFRLVVFADRVEISHGFVTWQHGTGDCLVFLRQLDHLFFDGFQVFRRKRTLV